MDCPILRIGLNNGLLTNFHVEISKFTGFLTKKASVANWQNDKIRNSVIKFCVNFYQNQTCETRKFNTTDELLGVFTR